MTKEEATAILLQLEIRSFGYDDRPKAELYILAGPRVWDRPLTIADFYPQDCYLKVFKNQLVTKAYMRKVLENRENQLKAYYRRQKSDDQLSREEKERNERLVKQQKEIYELEDQLQIVQKDFEDYRQGLNVESFQAQLAEKDRQIEQLTAIIDGFKALSATKAA